MSYADKVLAFSPLAYWILNEKTGSAVADSSGNGYGGTATNVTWQQRWIGEDTVALFDSGSDYVNIYSAGLASAFNGATGTLVLWLSFPDDGTWSDGGLRTLFNVGVTTISYVRVQKYTDGTLHFDYLTNSFTLVEVAAAPPITDAGWHQLALTWDKPNDEVKAYFDGVQLGTPQSGMGTWSGLLTSGKCYIGARDTGSEGTYSRLIGHVALWDVVLTAAQIRELAWIEMWTDRDADDLTNRTPKAFWNAVDYDRVNRASAWVHDQILDYLDLDVSLNALTLPALTTIPAVEDLNELIENVDRLRAAVSFPVALGLVALDYNYEAGAAAPVFDYNDVNTWENDLQLLRDGLDQAAVYFVACGVASCGQSHLWQARFR